MNILSYYHNSLYGKDIKNWIIIHTTSSTEYSPIAKKMVRYLNTLKDERKYRIELRPASTGCGKYKIKNPDVIRCV